MFLYRGNFLKFTKKILLMLLLCFACVIPAVPFHFAYLNMLIPYVASMIIFQFAILDKGNISAVWVFIFGIIYDAVNNFPLGMTSMIWLIVIKLMDIFRNKLFTIRNTITVSRDYAIFLFLVLLMEWLIMSIANRHFFSIGLTLGRFFYNAFLYFIFYKLFDGLSSFHNV